MFVSRFQLPVFLEVVSLFCGSVLFALSPCYVFLVPFSFFLFPIFLLRAPDSFFPHESFFLPTWHASPITPHAGSSIFAPCMFVKRHTLHATRQGTIPHTHQLHRQRTPLTLWPCSCCPLLLIFVLPCDFACIGRRGRVSDGAS